MMRNGFYRKSLANKGHVLPVPAASWADWDGSKDPAPCLRLSGNGTIYVGVTPLGDGRFVTVEVNSTAIFRPIQIRIGKRVGASIRWGKPFFPSSPFVVINSPSSANSLAHVLKIDNGRLFYVVRTSFGSMTYGVLAYSGMSITGFGTNYNWSADSNLGAPVYLSDRKVMIFSHRAASSRYDYQLITIAASGLTTTAVSGNVPHTAGTMRGYATVRIAENKFAIVASHNNTGGTNFRGGQVIVGELTNPAANTVSTGSWVVFNTTTTDAIASSEAVNNVFAVSYRNSGSSNQGVVAPVTFSGVTISGIGTAKETDITLGSSGTTKSAVIGGNYIFFAYSATYDTQGNRAFQRTWVDVYDISSGSLVEVRKNRILPTGIQSIANLQDFKQIDDYHAILAVYSGAPQTFSYVTLSLTKSNLPQLSWLKRSGNNDAAFQNLHSLSHDKTTKNVVLAARDVICGHNGLTNVPILAIVRFGTDNYIRITDTQDIDTAYSTDISPVVLAGGLVLVTYNKSNTAYARIVQVADDQITAINTTPLNLSSVIYNANVLIAVGTGKALSVRATSTTLKASFINVTSINSFSETAKVDIGASGTFNNTGNQAAAVCLKISNSEVITVFTRVVSAVKSDAIVLIDTSGSLPVINTILNLGQQLTTDYRIIALSNQLFIIAAVSNDSTKTTTTLYLVEKTGSSFVLRHTYQMSLGSKLTNASIGSFIRFVEPENIALFAVPLSSGSAIRIFKIAIDVTAKTITSSAIQESISVDSTSFYSVNAYELNSQEIAIFHSAISNGLSAGILRSS